MSRYFTRSLDPYVPGEQPEDLSRFVKLNTNENPYPPSERALAFAREHCRPVQLYSDLNALNLRAALAAEVGLEPENVLLSNGSDELLYFAFLAFCSGARGAVFPDISYGFYPVFARLCGVPYQEIPLRADLSIAPEDYFDRHQTVVLANPNAPTGLLLGTEDIRAILDRNRDSVVLIDEAYIDFGGQSCAALLREYDNLLVARTFSKSRSMAGARLGYAYGSAALIGDLETIRYSVNPYNVNSYTLALGLGTMLDGDYTRQTCRSIQENREYTIEMLSRRGFEVLPSAANFVFARHPDYPGAALYAALKARGVLVRHFDKPRIADYNRITIGTRAQMDALLEAVDEIVRAER